MTNGALAFDDALDAAIEALQRGRPLEAVVADFGRGGAMLRPLLETADAARQSIARPPLSRSLEHNYAIVKAAVERAQMAAAAQPRETTPRQPSFLRRRVTIASLSLPVGALALALTAGAAGATASLVATDHGGVLGEIVRPVVPDSMLPAALHDDDHRGAAPAASSDAQDANGPTEVVLDGTVSGVNGSTFTLTDGDTEYHVQIDANTTVDGEILEGGTAEVTGDLTADKNLHADSVTAEGGAADDRGQPDDAGKPDDPGQPGDPGQPADPGQPDDVGQPDDPGQPGDPPGFENQPDDPGQSGDPPGSHSEGGGSDNENSGSGGGPKKP
jgi:hypothetical protein